MRNSMLITRVSSLAIAAALTATASGQSLLGDHNVTFGSVNVLHGTGTTDLFVESQTAVLDWTPDDNAVGGGAINFQPSGTTATFFGSPNFAVLNRINVADPSRTVALNGIINSIVGESTGGNIFFYSPSGFVVGSTAAINVGSLVLSASPIFVDPNGNFLGSNGTTVNFLQAPNPNAAIATVAGSQINAFGAGSYVALVAPQITHRGTIRTDRAAALVAAEAATINFSPDGLFDIQVTVGADGGDRLHIDGGTITRNANTPEGTNHLAYLVAVAKNDAVTMLIENGGSVGFETATSATVENNVVILSGGDVVDGTPVVGNSDNRVDLAIDSSSFSSHVRGDFSGSIDIQTSTGDTSFGRNLALAGSQDSIITAINGNRLSIGGDLTVNLDESGFGADTSGNLLRLSASGTGSALSIGGNALLSSQVTGFGEGQSGVDAADVTGGTVIVQGGSGSSMDIRGSLTIDVDAEGGIHGGSNASAGSATGGTAHLLANGGSTVTIGGAVDISASSDGGGFEECSSCSITGGNGTGGTILLQAMTGTGNLLDIGGSVTLSAVGDGGAGDVTGGTGRGGTAQLVVGDASSIVIRDDLDVDVSAFGGFGSSDGDGPGLGGNAFGGNAAIQFQGTPSNGSITLTGASIFTADASGGNGETGGNATGGWVDVQVSANGTLTADFLGASADASGGDSDPFDQGSGAAGGTATGGRAWVQASTGGDIIVDDLSLSANASGGTGNSGNGGAATGGHVIASANNGTLTVANFTDLEANGRGGWAESDTGIGGLGTGGQADVIAAAGATVDLNGGLAVNADGFGGNYFSDGATGGSGVGGTIFLRANGATLDVAGNVSLSAVGNGGFSFGDCSFCGGTGGDGTGGTVNIESFGGAAGQLNVGGWLTALADGHGSGGLAGPGGDGQGGIVRLAIQGGAAAHFFGDALLSANGDGGIQLDGLAAGNGAGGRIDAFIGATGGTLTVDGFSDFTASGFGGDVEVGGGTGGNGAGGNAQFLALGGTATFNGLSVAGTGTGGSTDGGTGGNGTGNTARIEANGGDITIDGTAFVNTSGIGGNGTTGGDGFGGGNFFTFTGGAHIVAANGDIMINGSAIGFADGIGGNGANGGNGGDGTGGWSSVHAANSNGGPGSVTVQGVESSAAVSASGFGGNGGGGLAGIDGTSGATGTNGTAGGNGGNGGTGTGGVAALTASAGNGTINIGFGFATANGEGGAGGAGGNGGTGGTGTDGSGGNGGAGGIGGAGGAAFAGLASAGVETGNGLAAGSNAGLANFGIVEIDTSAQGGAGGGGGLGGAAGFGSPGGVAGADGNGGAGGNAESGIAELQARGGTVNVSLASLTSNATGGDGGAGAVDGAGGNAESDEAYVLVTNRVGNTALRGTLNADLITGTVTSTGGQGSTPGNSMMEGGSAFVVINGDATIGSLDFSITADNRIADLAADVIEIINATVQVDNSFEFNTDGVAAIYASNSTLTAGAFGVSASNFIHDPDRATPTTFGTISADTIGLITGQDLIVDANLISTSSLDLLAPGLIDVENVTSGGDLTAEAGSTIDGGTLAAAGFVTATAPGTINLNLVQAGSDIGIQSLGGDINSNGMSAGGVIGLGAGGNISVGPLTAAGNIQALSGGSISTGAVASSGGDILFEAADDIATGDLSAAGLVFLDAFGDISFGDAQADEVEFDSGGAVTGGNIIAGTQLYGQAAGAVTLGDISVGIQRSGGAAEDGFAVGVVSATSIEVGNVEADEAIGFATFGDLNTGDLNAGADVLTLIGGDTTISSIVAPGRTYHGDAQMFINAGGPDDFVPSEVFGEAPIRSGGSYTVTGAISTGQLQVAASSISTGNITAFDSATLDAADSASTGAIDTGLLQIKAGGDVTAGDIFAFDGVDIDAGGSILTGDIDAGSIDLLAVDDIGTGYLNTRLQLQQSGIGKLFLFPGASITLESGGDISTGDISSIDGVYINAGGSISTGLIDAFDFVEAHAGTSVATDDIDAGDHVLLTAANGAISAASATTPGSFQAIAGTNLTAGAVSAGSIDATAGGTATINGGWSAGDVQVTSDDIDIAATGSISAGDINLISTNATRTVVGDGIQLPGYQLSNAEYNRLNANDINVIADAGLGAAPSMLIGDLSVDASGGEGINDYEFITGDSETETAAGSIRILGDMVFTGMSPDEVVSFTTGTFELDAATGLLSLENAPGTLGGTLFLNAANIHVASGEILDQLATDPQYEGYQEDLNAPAAAQRPDGVIRAETVEIEFGPAELNTLYVQNSGTEETPAGFLISDLNLGDAGEAGLPANSIDLIINGQIRTASGTLTGIDVRDLLVDGRDLTPFSDNSTINGCLLVGPCGVEEPESPFPPGFTPLPGLPEEFELAEDNQLPPPLFGNEDFIDDNNPITLEGQTSPIKPPHPLFDTSELGAKGDVDDPVSGSGNPALMETPAGSASCPAGASQQTGTCKQEKQP